MIVCHWTEENGLPHCDGGHESSSSTSHVHHMMINVLLSLRIPKCVVWFCGGSKKQSSTFGIGLSGQCIADVREWGIRGVVLISTS